MAKKRRKRWKWVAAAMIMAGLVLLAVVLVLRGKPDETVVFDRFMPGAAKEGFVFSDTPAVDRLAQAAVRQLAAEQGYRSWLVTADRIKGLPSELSTEFLTRDQLLAARFHLEQEDEKSLLASLSLIRTFYLDDSGLPVERIFVAPDKTITKSPQRANDSVLAWLRLLAESYSLTGDGGILEELERASGTFLSLTEPDGTLPPDTTITIYAEPPRQDPAATPTIRPSITPTPTVVEHRPVIRLSGIDLYAIKMMIRLDDRWQTVYDRQRSILSGSYQSSDILLPAYAYDPKEQDYIGFAGSQPLVFMEDALRVLEHLYESGEPHDAALSYARSRFLSDGALYEQVHRATGNRYDDQECVAGYASLARIARITDDRFLYERATARLSWHIATGPRSEALGSIFRTDGQGRVRILATDNLSALITFW